jgi:hypothetical protein
MSIAIASMHSKKATQRAVSYSEKIREMAQAGDIKGLSSMAKEGNHVGSSEYASEYTPKELTDAAIEEAAEALKESHRRNFESLNFPNGGLNVDVDKSKHHSRARVESYIRIIQLWDDSRDTLSAEEKKRGITWQSGIVLGTKRILTVRNQLP